jgi:hypothetical protein
VSGAIIDMMVVCNGMLCNAVAHSKLVGWMFSGVMREESTKVIRHIGHQARFMRIEAGRTIKALHDRW